MFGNRQRIEQLEAELKDLRSRLSELEGRMTPLRVGDYYANSIYDSRPQVELRRVVEMLMAHQGLELKQEAGTPARTFLAKKPKRKDAEIIHKKFE